MRRTLIGLAAAGLLLVTACSDSDDDAASGDSFCEDFQALEDRFAEDSEAVSEGDEVLEGLESLDPPEEIEEDYQTLIELYRQIADVDVEDPEALAEAQEQAQELGDAAVEAEERVSAYLEDECGIEPAADAPVEGAPEGGPEVEVEE